MAKPMGNIETVEGYRLATKEIQSMIDMVIESAEKEIEDLYSV